jgi:hypothetical protein
MKTKLHDHGGVRIVECDAAIERADDALALVTACFENDATRVLLEARQLPAAFFELRTRFAGEFVQKLQNYGIRLAAVLPAPEAHGERFAEFVAEARRGRGFRTFELRADAEAWLASE